MHTYHITYARDTYMPAPDEDAIRVFDSFDDAINDLRELRAHVDDDDEMMIDVAIVSIRANDARDALRRVRDHVLAPSSLRHIDDETIDLIVS